MARFVVLLLAIAALGICFPMETAPMSAEIDTSELSVEASGAEITLTESSGTSETGEEIVAESVDLEMNRKKRDVTDIEVSSESSGVEAETVDGVAPRKRRDTDIEASGEISGIETDNADEKTERKRRNTEAVAVENLEKEEEEKEIEEKEVDTAEELKQSENSTAQEVNDTQTEGSGGEEKCESLAECFSHDECGGGRCVGAFTGTCNCNACLNFWACEDDVACGGLKGACGNITRLCDCFSAFTLNGLPSVMDAWVSLCNVKKCTRESADAECFGLPCSAGRCVC